MKLGHWRPQSRVNQDDVTKHQVSDTVICSALREIQRTGCFLVGLNEAGHRVVSLKVHSETPKAWVKSGSKMKSLERLRRLM